MKNASARKSLKAQPKPAKALVALPQSSTKTNGGVRCDMLRGPCACGAWH